MKFSLQRQQGISTLLTSVIFLLIMGIATLATNRASLAEQRMGSNEFRSFQAQQSAQAGLDLFIAQLTTANVSALADYSATTIDASTQTVKDSVSTSSNAAEAGDGLNYQVRAVKTTISGNTYLFVTSKGFSDCDSSGANCQAQSTLNSRIQYSLVTGTARTPATLSANQNIQACGAGQTGNQCSSINAYMNTYGGTPKYTTEAVTYGGQINGRDNPKDSNGRDVIDGSNTTVFGSDAAGPTTDKTAAKDVGTLSGDEYFKQFFGDTKSNIKSGSTTQVITPSQLKNVTIPPRGAADDQGKKPKPPVLWVTGNVTEADFGAFWNYNSGLPKDVVVIIEGNLSINSNNHGLTAGFMYVTGNVNATAGGTFDFYGAMGIEGSLNANTSFALRPQKDPNDLLNSFPVSSSLTLTSATWSDF